MKGGYQILDLSSITLVKDTETTITDLNILNQLLGLTDFLNKNGKIDKQLKPIYIITKDSAGYVSITNNDTNKLLIDGYISGLHIQLNITYTSSLDDYGNTVYAVSSAKYIYVSVDDNIKNIIESGEVDNAKPIYCHPILFRLVDGSNVCRSGCLILDNNPTPYTWDTFKAKCLSIAQAIEDTARIVCTGSCFVNNVCIINQGIDCGTNGNMVIWGFDTVGQSVSYRIDDKTVNQFFDGINKIN